MSDGRVIGFISGKGGVGKTSIAVNLAISLREFGHEVTIVDADFSASNLGVYLGRYDHPMKIQDVLEEEFDVASAIFRHPSGIKAMASSNEIRNVEPELVNLSQVFEEAAQDSDFVIVDCPPGLNSMVEAVMAACDELMIVTMPTQTAGINAAQIIERAKTMRQPVLGTIVNKVEGDPEKELIEREIEMMTESHVMANIPYDRRMKESLFHNEPLVTYQPLSEAALSIKELAAEIGGVEYERPKFSKFKRKFRELKDSFG